MYPLVMNVPSSPPETNVTLGHAHGSQTYRPLAHGPGSVSGAHDSASVAGPTLRRQPSIFYNNSPGYNRVESRERTPSSAASKLLVIVVPPVSVTQEHGALGHTLSSGPSHKLPHGIVMPLFPNMYGQMTAIAKEFNFPSITGLCLYYCFSDGEFSMTPRLSEDIWTTMWGLPEAASQPRDRRPPIVGRLEFDIDMAKARWYTAWLSSRQREATSEYPFYQAPVTAPNQHHRGDSRFTFPHTAVTDDISEIVQPHHSAPVGRHVPRKLSLVERFDVQSSHGTENGVQELRMPPSGLPVSSVLSPIKQLEEPKTARAELDDKVNTWRATAVASPVPMEASLPQESHIEPSTPSEVPLRMEDFQWSVTSAGPDDSPSLCWEDDLYEPSIHVADRAYGSVASTVSYCTSNGPSDYDIWFSLLDSRLPSPDIGHQFFEDTPPTPLTATSWGAPSYYSASIHGDEYEPSIDLGHRGEFSRPMTPVTATSWGPSTGPSSPLSPYRLPTPDIAHRGFEDMAQMVLQRWPTRPWRHAWPYNARKEEEGQFANKASRWVPVISKVIQRKKVQQPASAAPSGTGYPHFNLYPAATGKSFQSDPCGYPHNLRSIYPAAARSVGSEKTMSHAQYPYFELYPAVYPFNLESIYLQVAGTLAKPAIRSEKTTSRAQYPYFELYAAVYPFNLDSIYLQKAGTLAKAAKLTSIPVLTKSQYPSFELYAAVYPFNLDCVYPPVHALGKPMLQQSQLKVVEKVIASWRPWRHAWPYNRNRVQEAKSTRWAAAVSKVSKAQAPVSRASASNSGSGYVVKAKASSSQDPNGYPYTLRSIYPPVLRSRGESSTSRSQYPYFEIYAPVYPHNLRVIYPAVQVEQPTSILAPLVKSGYPTFEIYPSVYPFFNLYPRVAGSLPALSTSKATLLTHTSTSNYPYFTLYPTAYPHFDLYPRVAGAAVRSSLRKPQKPAAWTSSYPHFVLYPSVYPQFDLYPSIAGKCAVSSQNSVSASVSVTMGYPNFVLYPPVYPHFDLYPTVAGKVRSVLTSKAGRSLDLTTGYPHFTLYKPVYPYFDLYPSVAGRLYAPKTSQRTKAHVKNSGYPLFNIYPAVYPHFDLYPPVACSAARKDRQRGMRVAIETRYPFIVLYPAVYPHFELYPSMTRSVPRPRPSIPPKPALAVPARPLQKKVSFETQKARPKSGRLTHAELHAMVMMKGSKRKMWLDDEAEAMDSFPPVPITVPTVPRSVPTGRSRAPSISAARPQPPPLHVPSGRKEPSPSASPEHHKPLPLRRHPFPTEPVRPVSMYRTSPSSSASGSPTGSAKEGMTRSNSVAVRPRPRPPTATPLSQRRSMWEAVPPPTGPLPTRPLTVVSRADPGGPRRRDSLVSQRVKNYSAAPTTVSSSGGYL